MARMASSDWLTTRGASWLCSNTSPATTTNSAPDSAASAPRPATASRRAAEYRGCASPLRKCRVMPSCQSAVCTNRIPSSSVRGVGSWSMASVGPGADKSGDLTGMWRYRARMSTQRVVSAGAPASAGTIAHDDERRPCCCCGTPSRTTRPAVADHERPLAPRGEREAGLAGDWLRADVARRRRGAVLDGDPHPPDPGAHRRRRAGAVRRPALRRDAGRGRSTRSTVSTTP